MSSLHCPGWCKEGQAEEQLPLNEAALSGKSDTAGPLGFPPYSLVTSESDLNPGSLQEETPGQIPRLERTEEERVRLVQWGRCWVKNRKIQFPLSWVTLGSPFL